MKTLIVILILAVVVPVAGIAYIDHTINELVAAANIEHYTPVSQEYEPLVIQNTGFNDAGDSLQTVSGINVYQNAGVAIQ
jgi:hypothetical protein